MRIAARWSLLAFVAGLSACDDSPATEAEPEIGAVDAVDDAATDPAEDAASDAVSDVPTDGTEDGSGEEVEDVDVAQDSDGDPDGVRDTGPPPPDPLTASWCFRGQLDPERPGPDYDQFSPVIGSHCLGTNHQDIRGVQKLVFVGDSVTKGTPPTLPEQYFRTLLAERVDGLFEGELVVEDFSAFGRRVDDLIREPHAMLVRAFPEVEPLTTLVVFTIGGNDIFAWAEDASEGRTLEEIEVDVDAAIADLSAAMDYLDDPERFPNGVYVVYSNVYEFTDATGDTASCPPAAALGLGNDWAEGRAPVVRFNEAFMRLAVEHGFDMIFMLETFCGHGYRRDDPTGQCYRGPDAEMWFDFTCIHPTPVGHAVIADMFAAVIEE